MANQIQMEFLKAGLMVERIWKGSQKAGLMVEQILKGSQKVVLTEYLRAEKMEP